MNLPAMTSYYITLGCDPELFFKNDKGRVVGAELVMPEGGLLPKGTGAGAKPWVVIDGVQGELNPSSNACRESMAWNISTSLKTLHKHVSKKHPGIEITFDRSVRMTLTELNKLSDKTRMLGCSPSLNAYEKCESVLKNVNPLTHMLRSAGGLS